MGWVLAGDDRRTVSESWAGSMDMRARVRFVVPLQKVVTKVEPSLIEMALKSNPYCTGSMVVS